MHKIRTKNRWKSPVSLVSTDLIFKNDEFDKFTVNLEFNLNLAAQNKPYLVVFLGDFNAESKNGMAMVKPILKRI